MLSRLLSFFRRNQPKAIAPAPVESQITPRPGQVLQFTDCRDANGKPFPTETPKIVLSNVMVDGVPIEEVYANQANGGQQLAYSETKSWHTISPKNFKASKESIGRSFGEFKHDAVIRDAQKKFTLSRNEAEILYRFVDEWGECKVRFSTLTKRYRNDISNYEVRLAGCVMNGHREDFLALLQKIANRHVQDEDTIYQLTTIKALAQAWIAWRIRSAQPGFTGTHYASNSARLEFRRYLKKFNSDV